MIVKLLYEPEEWHACKESDWRTCTLAANCYAYILNRPDYYWAVPGQGFAKTEVQHFFTSFDRHFEGVTPSELRPLFIAGAIHDGLVQVGEPIDRKGYYLAALFFAAGDLDFHWYRKDDTGMWSHKDGWHAASDKDSCGQIIHDPRDDANTDYPVFGSFFLVPRGGVQLKQDFPLV
jgi:hypothetical protein